MQQQQLSNTITSTMNAGIFLLQVLGTQLIQTGPPKGSWLVPTRLVDVNLDFEFMLSSSPPDRELDWPTWARPMETDRSPLVLN